MKTMTIEKWLSAHNKSLAETVREETCLVHEGAEGNTVEARITIELDLGGDSYVCDRVIKFRLVKETE
jgi:hypothetical protein